MSRVLAAVATLALTADGGHVLTRPCDLYDGHSPTGGDASIIEYHWKKNSELERASLRSYAAQHVKDYAQSNHVCDASKVATQAAVTLVVDAVRTCPCPGSAGGGRHEALGNCSSLLLSGDAERNAAVTRGLARTTRVFIGDSRMSADARTYLQLLAAHCGEPLVTRYDHEARRARFEPRDSRSNFVARCAPLDASAVYLRENFKYTDEASSGDLWEDITALLRANNATRLLRTRVELIVGYFVWDIIDPRSRGTRTFLRTAPKHQWLADVVTSARTRHGADVVVRTAPPVNPTGPEFKIQGPFSHKLAHVRNAHDAWVAAETLIAGHTGARLLTAAQIAGEYQAALESALGTRVPLDALWRDDWHACVPLVTAQWVHLLPFMPAPTANPH